MSWYGYVLIMVLVLILLFVVFVGYIGAYRLFHPAHGDLEYTRRREQERSPGLMDIYDNWNVKKYTIKSRHGYDLAVYQVKPELESNRFVVFAHGYGYTHHGVVKYAKMMLALGFNVVMFDERFHGQSGGTFCSMGYYEKDDVYDLVSAIIERYGKDIIIGTYGESMGGAAVILEQAIDKRIHFVITDCTFFDLTELMLYQVKKAIGLMPQPFVFFTNLFFKIRTGVWLKDISPIKNVVEPNCPMLFVHGEEDEVIPPEHSKKLYESCKGKKAIYIAGNHARHTDSARYNEDEYLIKLRSFFKETVCLSDRSTI
jgi:dipeptidyl aminopeptidase/acylaminoacyl peptidase